jgi:hypothetical protein
MSVGVTFFYLVKMQVWNSFSIAQTDDSLILKAAHKCATTAVRGITGWLILIFFTLFLEERMNVHDSLHIPSSPRLIRPV